MQRLRTIPRAYRSPLLAGLILLIGAAAWAWQQRQAHLERERYAMIRHALSLESGLAILVEQIDMRAPSADAQLKSAVEAHLRVRPPMVFAAIHRDDDVVVRVEASTEPPPPPPDRRPPPHDRPPHARPPHARPPHDHPRPPEADFEPRAHRSDGIHTLRRDFGPRCPGGPPPGRPGLWSWDVSPSSAPDCQPLTLVVGVEAGFPAAVLDPANRRFALTLLLALLAIGALLLAWVRSIKARALRVELEAERRERSILSDMNLAGAGLAHETKNPLGIVFGLAQRLAQDPAASARQQEIAEQILDEADRATARLGEFIQFARVPAPVMAPVALAALIDRVLAVLQADFDARDVAVRRVGDTCTVLCDADMAQQLIVNLVLNGLQASPAGTTMQVGIERGDAGAILTVLDQGAGVPADLRADIFKPYVTGRADGHGLGLAIVKRIVDQHRWTITLADHPPAGTRVAVAGLEIVEDDAA